ncbi:chromosome segregation protein SMC [Candidatus Formimonas warabiya]|uniref:Chromosome partition protein Smc n=1 Tax=Formimonas warabiya TaxID=1761012 RepID=A0A3G1KQB6_FORW1|nr:chromosome segregation protein SMC [Candidatus Formimonas warabiya]ATW24627.1 chromosome segregation protein SMC [Candidatus Formimonas warabiya]
MYLKTIELHGFKSFTDRTKLEFGPGVSVIVGPNGSGKSNIADAIRWVLGEQSARVLRGSKMEDIIFAGTKKRKPLGMAEVSLTLDNSDGLLPLDYNEVTVTRRTYRSGEGEYLINNSTCRLKDVQNLFADTGMGSDGFSIIPQGKVDEILNAKSEERRSIIEETAGIVKYRNRKKEAARKLQETEQSLDRIQDIIFELSSQLDPLKEQAEQAKSYKKLKAEGDELEINLVVHVMEEVQEKLNEARESVDQKKLEMFQLEAGNAKLDSSVEELRFQIQEWDEEINQMQQELYQLFGQAEQTEAEVKLSLARQDALSGQIGKLAEEHQEVEEKFSALDQMMGRETQNHLDLETRIKDLKDLLAAREDNQKEEAESIENLERKIEARKNSAFDLMQEIADVRNKINNCAQHGLTLDNIWAKLTGQEKELEEFIKLNGDRKQSTEAHNREREKEIKAIQEEILALNEQIIGLEGTEQDLVQRNNRERESIQSSKARLNLLTEMQNDYEGYYPGVKAVLMAAKRKHPATKEVLGVIAELVKVPEPYRLAVETAFGGGLQDIVTDTDLGAKEAIEFLKKTKGGRATFLPLNTISRPDHKDLAQKVQEIPGFTGFASDLVSCEAKVRPAVDYLLKRIIVVKNMDVALQAARAVRYQAKIVTWEGDVINPGGSLTGGSQQKKAGNLLSRMGEIETLKKTLAKMEAGAKETERLLADCRGQMAGMKNDREKNMARERELEQELFQGRRDLAQLTEALDLSGKNLAAVHMEIAENRSKKEELGGEERILTEHLDQAEGKNQDLAREISTFQEQLKIRKENLTTGHDGLTEIKVKLAALTQEETAVKRTLHRLREEKDTLVALGEKKLHEKYALEKELAQKDQELLETKKTLLTLSRDKGEKEQALNGKKHHRTAESQRLGDLEKDAKENAKKLAFLQQEYHQWELKKNRWEMEWEKHLEKLAEKFKVSFEQALLKKKEIVSKRAVALRISEIEKEIAILGTVNLNAIEEYDRVNERYQFLSLQQKDLVEAREALYKVIGEMDRIMTQRFQDTFWAVSHQFNHTFNQLFGGGFAELRLTDPGNLLETGVEIVVQPPGKRLQHLSLLSGGEKALTGIALLFAILIVRPSPFCVLDEIEAALDEANVDRFAAHLHQFSGKTQFIVVSHRQGTMEIADVLYGVTMEENGISKSLSVKLADVSGISA